MNKPKYWRGLEELEQTPEFLEQAKHEFPTDVPVEDSLSEATEEAMGFQTDRRNFMKLMGFGLTAATLAACTEAPLKKAIPYVEKPKDILPGVPNYYASTTPDGVPVIVKTREGRPIKLEGNPDSPLTRGGLDAVGQASVLNLYDIDRLRAPMKGNTPVEWDVMDAEIKQQLGDMMASGKKVRLVTGTVMSPTTMEVIQEFVGQNPNAKHVAYDAVSASAISQAHENNFGKKVTPAYSFDKAEVIVGFSCDFLGTWLSPTEFMSKYAENRDPDKGSLSRHFQVESLMSMTGANADMRFPINPSQEGLALLNLYNKVARKVGKPSLPGVTEFNVAMNGLDRIAEKLAAAAGNSLVVCGTNDVATQEVVNAINHMLGSYGKTIDIDNPSTYKQGDDKALAELVGELSTVDAILFYDANPVYNTPYSEAFKAALGSIGLSISFASKKDETSELCTYTAPDHHFLESWNDSSQRGGHYSIVQPVINPIFNTRQAQDSMLTWMGAETSYYERLMDSWKNNYFSKQSVTTDFQAWWDNALRKGVLRLPYAEAGAYELGGDISAAARSLANQSGGEGMELALYETVAIRDGANANNPWLQELPDPVTRAAWDNYVTVPFSYAKANGLEQNDVVTVQIGDKSVKLSVMVQPGQAQNTLGIALGYGRWQAGRTAKVIKGSADVYPMVVDRNGTRQLSSTGASLSKTGDEYRIATIQTFHTLFDPAKKERFDNYYDRTSHIISETNFEAYKADPKAVNKERNEKKHHLVTLWNSHFSDRDTNRYIRWAMAIDLNKCTGCGACVVACNAENNIPVVGRKEMLTRREMHWMRIDRYYSGNPDNPDVVFQPMLCQHCDNAPCESVCPVLATVHSHEGINQMAYNRCVGTRYCANNCPYKVRRFNWFNYVNGSQFDDINPAHRSNPLGRFVLNPDVTVRFRGVMEKCSFCVQRLQAGKLQAKIAANSSLVKPEDGSIQTACQQTCPTGAIVFGDLNDPKSAVSKLFRENDRSYHALEEVKTYPSVAYMSKVRNRSNAEAETMGKEVETIMEENQWYVG